MGLQRKEINFDKFKSEGLNEWYWVITSAFASGRQGRTKETGVGTADSRI
jgi:hypothetical protein